MNLREFENNRWKNRSQSLEFRHRAALSFINEGPVLDIGCGDGLLLSFLKAGGIHGTGVDISPVAVALCVARGVTATEHDCLAGPLPFAAAFFSSVVALDVLEHAYDPVTIVREMGRVSRGVIILGVPNFNSAVARAQVLFGTVPENNRPRLGHIYWFNYAVLRKMLVEEGFSITGIAVNTVYERIPFMGTFLKACARAFPSFFGLSFVVRAEKI